jgi:hypothetical protein|tara:strand:+ start:393 stop:1463 length:1071 start_codon:yes stop_codon:yes gene_type:complete
MATYTQFSNNDTVNSIDRVFSSAWSGGVNDLFASHFSSSTQYVTSTSTSSGAFYMEIYDKDPSDSTAEVQYSIAYGSLTGKGGLDFNDDAGAAGFSATKAIYSQYRNLVFGGKETQNFSFNNYKPDGIYVININRARYKNALRLGNLNLQLSASAGQLLHLTDDSVTTSGSANAIRAGVGREFNLVSGSNGVRLGNSKTYVTNSGSYGYVYPDAGFIILNADALDHSGSAAEFAAGGGGTNLGTVNTSDNESKNPAKLQNALKLGSSFIVDAQEDISSRFYFIRVFNQDFNYTTNDSFTAKDGTLSFDSMIDNPQAYITTVGLYNNNQDLLAVAKLSQPLPKNFTKEALIKVKLDY